MPEITDDLKYTDDDSEFLDENTSINDSAVSDVEPVLPAGHRPKASLLRMAENSRMTETQCRRFLAAVELDLLRPVNERLNLLPVFKACCRNANRSWLNPAGFINRIDIILEKYLCSGTERSMVLTPVNKLLAELAEAGINPAAFLEYIIVPRLGRDYDWRRWNENHLEALNLIAEFLILLKKEPPFNREYLGNGDIRLVRDIVLVKYAGKPLSGFSLAVLNDKDLMDRYRNAWQRLQIDSPFTILFMKTNVLHFMYTMSGRIDFIQLVTIIENMPDIETGFRENFPERCFNIDVKSLKMSLYDYDMARSVHERKEKGFSSYDFVVELKAYLSIILALLGTGSGIYLCGYYAKKLAVIKNPDTARLFERLILAVSDNGGKNIYKWHTRRMLMLPAAQRDSYIDMVEANGGVDPSYPAVERFFDGTEHMAFDQISFDTKLNILGITKEDFNENVLNETGYDGKKHFTIPHHAWIAAYINHYPERKIEIDRYRDEVVGGIDSSWDRDRVVEIDALGTPLHESLLHSVIPGLSGTARQKSGSFQELMSMYSSVTDSLPLPVSYEFKIPVREEETFDKLLNAEVRSQINMVVIRQVWRSIEINGNVNPNNTAYFINMEYVKVREALEPKEQEYIETGGILAKIPDSPQRDALNKKYRSLEKGVSHIREQVELYLSLLREIDYMNESEKTIAALIVAGKQAETGSELAVFTIGLLIERYSSDATLQGRLEMLRNDVAIDLIHLGQLQMLVETIDSLARLTASDPDLEKSIKTMIARSEEIESLLAPFIILKTKKLSMEAVDAALRHVAGYARLTAERSKWQELMESFNKKDSKFFEPYRLYASRSIMDAYYGDMGSICLSAMPEAIRDPDLQVIRLTSGNERKIKGILLMYRSKSGLSSYMEKRGAFWHSFAFNPIPSMLHKMTRRQMLNLYINYRRVIEDVSRNTGMPVVLSGINSYGIVSNDISFSDLIVSVERKFKSVEVNDATGLSIFYSESAYSEAMVIVDPKRPETYRADRLLNSFSSENGEIKRITG